MLERLRGEEKEVNGRLAAVAHSVEEHLNAAHDGKIATTCHKCISLTQGVLNYRATLEEIRQEIENIINPVKSKV